MLCEGNAQAYNVDDRFTRARRIKALETFVTCYFVTFHVICPPTGSAHTVSGIYCHITNHNIDLTARFSAINLSEYIQNTRLAFIFLCG